MVYNSHSILITGANGFLGGEIMRQVLAAGFSVRAMDRRDSCSLPRGAYVQADILDSESLIPVLRGMDTVIHAAGLAHIFGKRKAATSAFKGVNETGTANVAKAAGHGPVRHFILISSVAVYGKPPAGGCRENAPCQPRGPYAESKYGAEQRVIAIAEKSQMNLTILRFGTAYGGGDPGNVNRLIRAIDRRRFMGIGPGSNRKSLIHRTDVGRACLAVLQNPPRGINIYNVAGQPFRMKEIMEEISLALGRSRPRWYIPPRFAMNCARMGKSISSGNGRLNDLFSTIDKWLEEDIYDSTKFEKTFRFNPQIGLREGLEEEVAWYLEGRGKRP